MPQVAASNQRDGPGSFSISAADVADSEHGHNEDGTHPQSYIVGAENMGGQPAYIRAAFIRKVYVVLCFMLFITTVVAIPSYFVVSDSLISTYVIMAIYMSSLFTTLAMACCCMGAMRSYPTNLIFLVVFAFLYGIILGFIAVQYKLISVALAAGLTLIIFVLLTFYACFTKSDFTGMGPYLMVALCGLIGFGIMTSILGMCGIDVEMMQTVYAALGAVLFSFYIVYDTQVIVGGTHKQHQLGVDDWAFGALALYLDIINLFLSLLQLVGSRN